jgi:hypothetical protein
MRKAAVLAIVAAFAMGVNQASAYTIPSGWTSNPYYTHETWTFDTNAATSDANAGYTNPGTPSVTIDNSKATWLASGAPYGFGYTGVWNAVGPLTDATIATFTIPQTPQPNTSSVQVNAIMQTNDPTFQADFELAVYSNGVKYYASTDSQVSYINHDLGIIEVTNLFKDIAGFTDPVTCTMKIKNMGGSGYPPTGYGFANFDYVTIDTVPEPGTVAMLLAGTLALLGWASLRRRS